MNESLKKDGQRSIAGLLKQDRVVTIYQLLEAIAVLKTIHGTMDPDCISGRNGERIDDLLDIPNETGVDRHDAFHKFMRFGGGIRYYCCESCGAWSTHEGGKCVEPECDGTCDYKVCIHDFEPDDKS